MSGGCTAWGIFGNQNEDANIEAGAGVGTYESTSGTGGTFPPPMPTQTPNPWDRPIHQPLPRFLRQGAARFNPEQPPSLDTLNLGAAPFTRPSPAL